MANFNGSSQKDHSRPLQEPRLEGMKLHGLRQFIFLTCVLLFAKPTTARNSPTSDKPRVRGGSRRGI